MAAKIAPGLRALPRDRSAAVNAARSRSTGVRPWQTRPSTLRKNPDRCGICEVMSQPPGTLPDLVLGSPGKGLQGVLERASVLGPVELGARALWGPVAGTVGGGGAVTSRDGGAAEDCGWGMRREWDCGLMIWWGDEVRHVTFF